MVCNQCGTANPDGVKFCAGCGMQIDQAPMQEPQAPVQETVRRSRPGKPKAAVPGIAKVMVLAFMVLSLMFGIVHLFVDYVITGKTTTITITEESKTIEKDDSYQFKSEIYRMIKDKELQEVREGMDEIDGYVLGSYVWIQLGNIVCGITFILLTGIGVLYLVGFYDQIFGKILTGRTPLFVMGLLGAAMSVLQMLCYWFSTVRIVVKGDELTTKATASFSAHWTIWAFLLLSLVAVVCDLKLLPRKKK